MFKISVYFSALSFLCSALSLRLLWRRNWRDLHLFDLSATQPRYFSAKKFYLGVEAPLPFSKILVMLMVSINIYSKICEKSAYCKLEFKYFEKFAYVTLIFVKN